MAWNKSLSILVLLGVLSMGHFHLFAQGNAPKPTDAEIEARVKAITQSLVDRRPVLSN